jgi:hypothetical protein
MLDALLEVVRRFTSPDQRSGGKEVH